MIKAFILTTIALGISICGESSSFYQYERTDTIYSFTDVDKTPEPESGMPDLFEKWGSFVRYPADARRNRIEGKVFIYFIVDENGTILESGILKGLGHGCDEATLEAFKKVNLKWRPGIKDGQNVKVKMVMPFVFKLG